MDYLILPLLALVAFAALGGFAMAQNTDLVTPKRPDLLRKETPCIDDASQQILAALVLGDDARVAVRERSEPAVRRAELRLLDHRHAIFSGMA